MSEELDHCPFCGAQAEWDYEGDDGLGRVTCTNLNCGASIFDDRDSAVTKWNIRFCSEKGKK